MELYRANRVTSSASNENETSEENYSMQSSASTSTAGFRWNQSSGSNNSNTDHVEDHKDIDHDPIIRTNSTISTTQRKILNGVKRLWRACTNRMRFPFHFFNKSEQLSSFVNDEDVVGESLLKNNKKLVERSSISFCKVLIATIFGFLIASLILGTTIYIVLSRWIQNQAGDVVVNELIRKGNLKHLLQQVIDRLYLYDIEGDFKTPKYQIGIDTSHDGEFSLLIRHMLNNPDFSNYEEQLNNIDNERRYTIVDIGAHDCLSGSNSFNLIKMGFDALLVEPSPANMKLCKGNLERAKKTFRMDQLNPRQQQRIEFVDAAITNSDGLSTLGNRDESDSWGMQFFVDNKKTQDPNNNNNNQNENGKNTIHANQNGPLVKTFKFGSFAREYNLPKKFSVLSIDAEGQDLNILLSVLRDGFKPLYLIYEGLHGVRVKVEVMSKYGYQLIGERGWNQIYVYRAETDNTITTNKKNLK